MLQALRFHLFASVVVLAACSSGMEGPPASPPPGEPPASPPPASTSSPSLTPEVAAVFVGDRARLTPVFDGDGGSIDGIGSVRSGVAVETAILLRTTTFTMRVPQGAGEVEVRATVQVSYRNRIRVLAAAPIAQTNHLAAALPGGRAIAMGGNTSETLALPDSVVTQVFDPVTERFAPRLDLAFSAATQQFTSAVQLTTGSLLLVGTGLNAAGGPPLHPVITQVFDPATPGFRRVGDVTAGGISFRIATPLLGGGALLSGGFARASNPVTSAVNRYSSESGQWTLVDDMLHVRVVHTATLLRDGRVLVAGGLSCCHPDDVSPEFYESAADIYDPSTDKFT